ncbi:hypothetical protein [Chromobacterium sphagni]|uniref:hypothetical protein n=1 Tax=Chromobacterium sphagni TaxID=1903179 RepID=UPI0019D3EC69|nr:hypothetical protein [Chromobacterium sphagni]
MNTKKLKIFDYNPAFLYAEKPALTPYQVRHRGKPVAGSAILPHGTFVLIDQLNGFLSLKHLVVRAFLHQEDRELSTRALVSEHHEHQDKKWHSCIIQQKDVIQDFGCYSSYISRAENTQWHETLLRYQSQWHGSLDMIRLIEFLKSTNPPTTRNAIHAAENQLNHWYQLAARAIHHLAPQNMPYA